MGKSRRVKVIRNKPDRLIDQCHKDFRDAYHVLRDLLRNRTFVKAAAEATNPNDFRKNLNTLLEFAREYENYRISLSSTNGRTYFDSAFPVANHNGINVKDSSGNNIDVSGGIEIQYANLVAYDILCEGSESRIGKHGIGTDVRWDETVKAIQYFVARTIKRDCDPTAFVLRISRKPLLIINGGGIPIQADRFAIIDDQPFIIIGSDIIPIKPENIVVVGNQRFALVNGQTFLLPRTDDTTSTGIVPL